MKKNILLLLLASTLCVAMQEIDLSDPEAQEIAKLEAGFAVKSSQEIDDQNTALALKALAEGKKRKKHRRKKAQEVQDSNWQEVPVPADDNDKVDGFAELEQGLGLEGSDDAFGQTALSVYDALKDAYNYDETQLQLDGVKRWLLSIKKQNPEGYEELKKTIVRAGGKENGSLIKTVLEVGFAIAGEIRDHNRESTRVGEAQLKEAENARKVAQEALETQKKQAAFYKRSTYVGIATTSIATTWAIISTVFAANN